MMKDKNMNDCNSNLQEQKNLQPEKINDLMVESECKELFIDNHQLTEAFNDPLKRLECLEQSVQMARNNLEIMFKTLAIKTRIIQQKMMRMKTALETIDKYDNGDDNYDSNYQSNRSNTLQKLFQTRNQFQALKFSSQSSSME